MCDAPRLRASPSVASTVRLGLPLCRASAHCWSCLLRYLLFIFSASALRLRTLRLRAPPPGSGLSADDPLASAHTLGFATLHTRRRIGTKYKM